MHEKTFKANKHQLTPTGQGLPLPYQRYKPIHLNSYLKKLLYIAKEVFIEIPNKKNIVPDSPCLNNSLIFGAISKAKFDSGLSLDLNPKINDNLTELFTALCDCPEHLIESAKMFFFFEHLIKHHSLDTLIASTINNIAPRAEKI